MFHSEEEGQTPPPFTVCLTWDVGTVDIQKPFHSAFNKKAQPEVTMAP